jgi:MFS transporter, DHA1 family, inner membrane transport protein
MQKERWILLLLAAVNFTHIVDFMIMMPLSTHIMPVFKINPQQFSFVVSAYTFSAGLAGFAAAFFVDKFDRKKVLTFGYGGFLLGTLCCALAPSYKLLLVARIVAGLFGGLIGAQVLSIVADLVPFSRRAKAMGIIMAGFGVASVVGVPAGLLLAINFSWHMPFLFVFGLGLIILIIIQLYLPSMKLHLQQEALGQHWYVALQQLMSNKNQRKALTLMVVMMLGHFSIIPFIAPYMEHNVGLSKEEVGYIYLVGGMAALVSAPLVGKLADQYGKQKIYSLFVVMCTVPLLLITHMPPWPLGVVLLVAFIFFSFTTGRFIPAQAIVSQVVVPAQRGSFMSINSALQQLAAGFAALLAGTIVVEDPVTHSLSRYNWVGIIALCFTLLSLVLVRRVKPLAQAE